MTTRKTSGTAKKRQKTERAKQLSINLLVLAAALIIFFLVAETAVRLATMDDPRYENPPRTKGHPDYVYTRHPDIEYSRFFVDMNETIRLQTNAKGFPGELIPYENPEDKRRIFITGDSMTECYHPGQENCYTTRLEELLGPEWQVISMASSSYATDNEYKIIEKEGVRYEPEIVIVQFVWNDIGTITRNHIFKVVDGELVDRTPVVDYRRDSITWVTTNSHFARMLYLNIYNINSKRQDKHLLIPGAQLHLFQEETQPEEAYEKLGLIFGKLQELSETNDFELYVLIIPFREQVNAEARKALLSRKNLSQDLALGLPYQRVINELEERNISSIYPLDSFITYETTSSSYYKADVHLNARGHERLAKEVYERITQDHE